MTRRADHGPLLVAGKRLIAERVNERLGQLGSDLPGLGARCQPSFPNQPVLTGLGSMAGQADLVLWVWKHRRPRLAMPAVAGRASGRKKGPVQVRIDGEPTCGQACSQNQEKTVYRRS